MKILIVDDIEVNLELLEARLEGSGYEVAYARNGIEALDKLKSASIDMIISDILMPRMDGFQLCRECKKDDTLRKIPFMFYTATYTDKKDEEFALSLGAERFLVKPVESNRFMEIIDGILKDYKKGLLPPSEMPTEKGKAVYLEEYNERLINKLEKKMLDLESKIIEHKLAEDEIRKLNEELEQRVSERTSQLNESKEALLNLVDDLNIASDNLKSANERLQELDRLKSMFIASMSHELRTPLNSIIGFTGIILQGMTGEINPEQRNQLQRVYGSAKHLLALINDVIDISKIEAGKFEVHVEEFSLDGVIREAVSNLTPEITDKGLDLEISLPQDTRLTTDRKRLLQCILNFLSNAVKFTEKGEIKVAAHEVDGMMEIAVKDTGIGIKKEDLPRLFGSFVRLDSALTIKTTGTGLGLYLTRKIATEMLGGEVSVKSTYGKGSTFILKVPKEI